MNIPNPDFRFLENKGYLTSEFFQRNWFDEFSDHINLIEVVLVLLPATQVSKTYTVSQYVSKVSGIAKVRYTIFTIQKARIPLGSLNLNPTFTPVSTVGKAFEFTLRGIQKGSEIAAKMSIGVGTDLSVTTYTNQYVGALFGNLIDLSPSKTARLVEKVIEKSPKTIADVGIKAGVKKEVAEIAAQRVVKEVLPKEMAENEGICTWFVKFLKEEDGSIDIPLTRSEPKALERCGQEVRDGLEANIDEAYIETRTSGAIAPVVEPSEAIARKVELDRLANPSLPLPGTPGYDIANLPTELSVLENMINEELIKITTYDNLKSVLKRGISDPEATQIALLHPEFINPLGLRLLKDGYEGRGFAHSIAGHITEYSDPLENINFLEKTLVNPDLASQSTRGRTILRQYIRKLSNTEFDLVVIGDPTTTPFVYTHYKVYPTLLKAEEQQSKSILASIEANVNNKNAKLFVKDNQKIIHLGDPDKEIWVLDDGTRIIGQKNHFDITGFKEINSRNGLSKFRFTRDITPDFSGF